MYVLLIVLFILSCNNSSSLLVAPDCGERRHFSLGLHGVLRPLLFQCGIQFCCSRQAEILQGPDLRHGSVAIWAAPVCHAVSPHPIQAHL